MSSAPAEECLSWNSILADMPPGFAVRVSPKRGITIVGPWRIDIVGLLLYASCALIALIGIRSFLEEGLSLESFGPDGIILLAYVTILPHFRSPLCRIWIRVYSRWVFLWGGDMWHGDFALSCRPLLRANVSRVLACARGTNPDCSAWTVTERSDLSRAGNLSLSKTWLRIETVNGNGGIYGVKFRLTFPEALWLARAVRFALGHSWQDPAYSSVPQSAATTSGAPPSA